MAEKALTPEALGRHDMVFLNEEALCHARAAAQSLNKGLAGAEAERYITPGIPAIIARQRGKAGGAGGRLWDAGFSLPQQLEGTRLRFRTVVPQGGITRVVTPFGAAGQNLQYLNNRQRLVLKDLRALGAACAFKVGVYGSLALHILTGLPYHTAASDYDIYICKAEPQADPEGFYRGVLALEKRHNAKIDVEIACLEDSGAKLAELYSGQATVLCKGLYGVTLQPAAQLPLR